MKKSLVLCVLVFTSHWVSADLSDIDRFAASICDYIKTDDRTRIRKKLRTANLNLRQVYPALVCQPEGQFPGGSLLRAAAYYGAVDVSSFIIRKISANDVALTEHDGISTIEWAKQAVSTGTVSHVEKAKAILDKMENRITG